MATNIMCFPSEEFFFIVDKEKEIFYSINKNTKICKVILFSEMDELSKECKNMNVLYKPYALLAYQQSCKGSYYGLKCSSMTRGYLNDTLKLYEIKN